MWKDPLNPIPGEMPEGFPRQRSKPPSRATRVRQLIWGLTLFLCGLVASCLGFFEMSTWNVAPTGGWAIFAFAGGLILLVVGSILCLMAAPEFFDSGNKGI